MRVLLHVLAKLPLLLEAASFLLRDKMEISVGGIHNRNVESLFHGNFHRRSDDAHTRAQRFHFRCVQVATHRDTRGGLRFSSFSLFRRLRE